MNFSDLLFEQNQFASKSPGVNGALVDYRPLTKYEGIKVMFSVCLSVNMEGIPWSPVSGQWSLRNGGGGMVPLV